MHPTFQLSFTPCLYLGESQVLHSWVPFITLCLIICWPPTHMPNQMSLLLAYHMHGLATATYHTYIHHTTPHHTIMYTNCALCNYTMNKTYNTYTIKATVLCVSQWHACSSTAPVPYVGMHAAHAHAPHHYHTSPIASHQQHTVAYSHCMV